MKQILFVVLMCLAVTVSAQNVYPAGGGRGNTTLAIIGWNAFAADSSATYVTNVFNIADFDSITVYAKGTSVTGTAKFKAELTGAWTQSVSTDTLWLGIALDTTNCKLEILKKIGTFGTNGMPYAYLKLIGTSVATAQPIDTKATFYLVCRKRGYANQ